MKSAKRGKHTSPVEVTNVSPHGVWLLLDDDEHFLPFDKFPWFRDATIGEVANVRRPQPHHLFWPDLDVDLAVDSIRAPERFPLVSRAATKKRSPRKSARPAAKSQLQKRP